MTRSERSAARAREHGMLALSVRHALGTACVTVLSMTAPLAVNTALAQEQQASSDVLQEITVTGTRIVRDGYEAPTPVSVLGMEQLAEMAAEVDASFANTYFNLALVQCINKDFPAAVSALTKYQALVSQDEARNADELLRSLKESLAAAKNSRLKST